MLPCGTKLFVHVYESKTLKKVVEIKVLRPHLILFEYANGNMTLIIINWLLVA